VGPTNAGPYFKAVVAKEFGYLPWIDLMTYLRTKPGGNIASVNLSLPAINTDSLRRQAAVKAVSRLSSLSLSVSAWEAREIPSLFALFKGKGRLGKLLRREILGDLKMTGEIHTLKRLLTVVWNQLGNRYRKKRPLKRELRDQVLSAAEAQLLWSFGIAPTISDVKAIVREIRHGSKGYPAKGVTSGASAVSTTTSNGAVSVYKNVFNVTTRVVTTRTDTVTVRVTKVKPKGVTARMNDINDKIDRYLGANQAGNIWAVVPFSFMIDWLVSIDDYLDEVFLKNSPYLKSVWCYSRKLEHHTYADGDYRSGALANKGDSPALQFVFSPLHIEELASRFIRDPMVSPDTISLLPRSRASIKKTYLASLIALGVFSNRPR
jgi:hypothetical protein